ncbi:MAG TPA: hypothetical protein VM509_05860, partial [Planctomycetota bacterium]|nr:hypothetical protein [Planctomycetota bacterium]
MTSCPDSRLPRRLTRALARRARFGRASCRLAALGFALLSILASACSKPGGLVILDPQNPERDYDIDLGNMAYGDVREHVVKLKNAEGRAVAIQSVQAGCTCTSVKLASVDTHGMRVEAPSASDGQPFVLPKDAVLEVALRVDSKIVPVKNSTKRVLVRIQTDSVVDAFKTLEVHTIVEAPFVVVPPSIALGQVAVGAIAQGKTEISRWNDTGELVTGVLSKPDNMDVVLEAPEQLGLMMWRLHVRWFPPFERGSQMRSVVLSTTGPGGEGVGRPLEIQVTAIGVENVIAEPMLFTVPERLDVNGGAGAVTLRSMVKGNRLRVTGGRTEGPA